MELTQNDLKMMAISVLIFTLQPRKLENQLISISKDLKNPTGINTAQTITLSA